MTNHAHILLRSGPSGLPQYMRRLLSGYAISYNRRHRRHGYLFQNRYKSDQTRKEQFSAHERLQRTASHIEKVCKQENVRIEALKSGSRRQKVVLVTSQLSKTLVADGVFHRLKQAVIWVCLLLQLQKRFIG